MHFEILFKNHILYEKVISIKIVIMEFCYVNLQWVLILIVLIKYFFLADTSRPHNAAVTKAVYGVCVDPHVEHRIASFSEVSREELCKFTVVIEFAFKCINLIIFSFV